MQARPCCPPDPWIDWLWRNPIHFLLTVVSAVWGRVICGRNEVNGMARPRQDETAQVLDLVGEAYDAALDPELWPSVLREALRVRARHDRQFVFARRDQSDRKPHLQLGRGAPLPRSLCGEICAHQSSVSQGSGLPGRRGHELDATLSRMTNTGRASSIKNGRSRKASSISPGLLSTKMPAASRRLPPCGTSATGWSMTRCSGACRWSRRISAARC